MFCAFNFCVTLLMKKFSHQIFPNYGLYFPYNPITTLMNLMNLFISAERNNRLFGLFVRNGDIRMFSSQ